MRLTVWRFSKTVLASSARDHEVLTDYQEQLAALEYPGRART